MSLLRESIGVDPTNSTAHFNLGLILTERGDAAAAIMSHRRAVEASGPPIQDSVVRSLRESGDARRVRRGGRCRTPRIVRPVLGARCRARQPLDRTRSPRRRSRRARQTLFEGVRRNPDSAEAWFWMGQALHLRGEIPAALSSYDRTIAIDPGHVLAHARRGTARLAIGDFAGGWPEYEWRLRAPGANTQQPTQPRWNGESLQGQTILVSAEQGLGDAIQMLRYVALLADDAATVLVEVDAAIAPLVPRRRNVLTVARGTALPPFDVYCPLLSLPLAFGTTVDSIPAAEPVCARGPIARSGVGRHSGECGARPESGARVGREPPPSAGSRSLAVVRGARTALCASRHRMGEPASRRQGR